MKAVVIGLQSTGDAAVSEVVTKRGSKKLPALVSTARGAVEGLLATVGDLSAMRVGAARAGAMIVHGTAPHGRQPAFEAFCNQVEARLDGLELPVCALDELVDYFGARC